jgi:hypothetical protein
VEIQHSFIELVTDAHTKASASRQALGDKATEEEKALGATIAWRVWGPDLARNHTVKQAKRAHEPDGSN